MDFQALAYPAAMWVTVTSLGILLSFRWRWCIAILALQYLGIFILTASAWPIEMAAVKLVAGWLSCAVLAMAISESMSTEQSGWRPTERSWPSSRIFRLLSATLVLLSVQSLSSRIPAWIPGLDLAHAWSGLILIGMGLIQLGLTAQPSRVVIGLLTLLSGFEILYATVETSALLAGLLAAVNMSIALIGAYLIASPAMEGPE